MLVHSKNAVNRPGIFLYSGVSSICILAISFLLAEPMYWVNDDIGMQLIADGKGAYHSPSPLLIFSNVIWGYVIQLMPSVFGISQYSVATIGLLFLIYTGIIAALLINGTNKLVVILICALILFRPSAMPQFTISSGLSALAGTLWLLHYLRAKSSLSAKLTFIFIALAFLIRWKEMVIVCAVASPLIIASLIRYRSELPPLKNYIIGFIAFASIAILLDKAHYGSDWNHFTEFQPVRAKFIDEGYYWKFLHANGDPADYGFTKNDLKLVKSWFFGALDEEDFSQLDRLVSSTNGDVAPNSNYFSRNLALLRATIDLDPIFFLCVASVIGIVLSLRVDNIAAVIIAGSAMAYLAYIGRPEVIRVYLPLIYLLFVKLIYENCNKNPSFRQKIIIAILLASSGSYFLTSYSLAKTREIKAQSLTLEYQGIDLNDAWVPGTMGSEYLNPLLAKPFHGKFKYYSMGWSFFAPKSNAYEQWRAGFWNSFTSPSGIRILLNEGEETYYFTMLARACRERFDAPKPLKQDTEPEFTELGVYQMTCGDNGTTTIEST